MFFIEASKTHIMSISNGKLNCVKDLFRILLNMNSFNLIYSEWCEFSKSLEERMMFKKRGIGLGDV